MGKDSPSPPAAPDYPGAAVAQGAANEATARLQGRMNNPNISGPLGSQTVTFGTPSFDQANYDKAMSAYQASPRGAVPMQNQFYTEDGFDTAGYQNAMNSWAAGTNAPTKEQYTTTTGGDQPTITQTLTPQAQATLDAQQRVQRALAGLGEQGLGTASRVLGTGFNPNLAGLQTNLGNAGQIAQAPDLGRYGQASGNVNAGQISQAPELSRYGMAGANVNAQGVNAGPQAGQYGMSSGGPSAGQYGFAGGGPQSGQYGFASGGLNTSNVAAMPVSAGMTGQQAIMSRLAPQLEKSDAAMRQRLANQGLVAGGEAFENAMLSQNQQKNDLLTQAALQGIGLDTAANAQGFNQALAAGQFGNQAVGQNFGQGVTAQQLQNAGIAQNFGQGQAANAAQNAAIGQNFNQGLSAQQAQNAAAQQLYNQNMGVQGLQNQAIGQNQQAALSQQQAQLAAQQQGFGQNVTQQQLGNQAITQNQQAALQQQQAALAAQNQQFNQLLQGGQFGNTAQQQSLQQQLALRNQPLNEITGLMGGSQIQMPQFQGYQGSNIAAAPVMAGAQAAGQAAMDQYGIQSSNVNAANAGLYNLAGAGLMAAKFSDRRLKSNIEHVGTHPLGIGVYEYDIFGNRERGVMADEVLSVMPNAVSVHPSGFMQVDYWMLQ